MHNYKNNDLNTNYSQRIYAGIISIRNCVRGLTLLVWTVKKSTTFVLQSKCELLEIFKLYEEEHSKR